jgi:hypothetical protein
MWRRPADVSGARRARLRKDSFCLHNVGQRFAQRRKFALREHRLGFSVAWLFR